MLAVEQQWEQQRIGKAAASDDVVWRRQQWAGRQHWMMTCGSSSNALLGQRILKATVEAEMAAAIGIILYSSSVIIVGCVFA